MWVDVRIIAEGHAALLQCYHIAVAVKGKKISQWVI